MYKRIFRNVLPYDTGKVFSILLITLIIATFVGCDGNDNGNPLIGLWKAVAQSHSECNDPDQNYVNDPFTNFDYTLELRSDNTYSILLGNDAENRGTYSVSHNRLTFLELSYELSYSLVGNKLVTLSDPQEDFGCIEETTWNRIN